MARIALIENSVDYEELEAMGLLVVTFIVRKEHSSVLGEAVINLNLPDLASIVAIYRGEEVIVLNESTQLQEGDLVCVLGKKNGIDQFNRMMGMPREAKDFVILGGGIIGRRIAKLLEKEKYYVRLLEKDENKCHALSRDFDHVLVINANAVDPRALRAENVGAADVLISATNSDEKNLLACLVARQLGIHKVISRYSRREYEDVFAMTSINGAIGYHRVVANEIIKRIISDESAILQMRHQKEIFFSITLNEKSGLSKIPVGDLKLPDGSRIVAIMRDGEAIFPRLNTPLMVGDKLLIYAYDVKMSRLERLFHIAIEAGI
jgi:trk system potassium uptake protein TrkA